MDNDNRMVDLLVDLLYEAKESRQEQFAMRQELVALRKEQIGLQQEQISLRHELKSGLERNTQAIMGLTSLLQKAIIEPTVHQASEIADLKQRVEALEKAR